MQYFKYILCNCVLILYSLLSFAQTHDAADLVKAANQKKLLSQYTGTCFSTDNIADKKPGKTPNIKMTVTPKMDSSSLQVEVFQLQKGKYFPLRV